MACVSKVMFLFLKLLASFFLRRTEKFILFACEALKQKKEIDKF